MSSAQREGHSDVCKSVGTLYSSLDTLGPFCKPTKWGGLAWEVLATSMRHCTHGTHG